MKQSYRCIHVESLLEVRTVYWIQRKDQHHLLSLPTLKGHPCPSLPYYISAYPATPQLP